MPSPKSKVSEEDIREGAEIFVEGIAYLHDMAAEQTGYRGFAMTPRRTKLWTRSLKFLLKHVKVDKWPELMAVMWLGLDEGLMIMGYFMWKKNHGAASREPPSMRDEPPAGAYAEAKADAAARSGGYVDSIGAAGGFVDHL
jgi:hypothetical protein